MKNTNESTNIKKPFYKKWWFIAIVGIILLSAIFGSNDEENKTIDETPSVVETNEDKSTEEPKEEKLVIELVAGEQGEYGKMITYNKGTEFEETFYAYYVPAGTYTVTNTGKYMNQINVYSNETNITEDGWEEPAEVGMVKLLDVGQSDTISVEEGQHIDIGAENSYFKLEQQ